MMMVIAFSFQQCLQAYCGTLSGKACWYLIEFDVASYPATPA